jgi:hypothetical protein
MPLTGRYRKIIDVTPHTSDLSVEELAASGTRVRDTRFPGRQWTDRPQIGLAFSPALPCHGRSLATGEIDEP